MVTSVKRNHNEARALTVTSRMSTQLNPLSHALSGVPFDPPTDPPN